MFGLLRKQGLQSINLRGLVGLSFQRRFCDLGFPKLASPLKFLGRKQAELGGGNHHRSLSSAKFALWEVKQNQLVSRPVVKPGILHSETFFLVKPGEPL